MSPKLEPATLPPDARDEVRLLVIDRGDAANTIFDYRMRDLSSLLAPGDLVVVNDAAALPASLVATTVGPAPEAFELRLVAPPDGGVLHAVAFGAGDWRMRTEDRPVPPSLAIGDDIVIAGATASVIGTSRDDASVGASGLPVTGSDRLVALRLADVPDAWSIVYAHGRPIQYSYLAAELPLYAFQTAYAARPWAVEMPSAGRALTWETLAALRARGVALASLTHAAGLSSTGDPILDRALPLPERYAIPAATLAAIAACHARGGRVVAVGTTVVRALEGAFATHGHARLQTPHALAGITDLRIVAGFVPRIVDGILSGMHEEGESHFDVLAAFVSPRALAEANAHAAAVGYHAHELGDATLALPACAAAGRS